MHGAHEMSASTQSGLAWFYLCMVLMNLGFAAYQFRVRKNMVQTTVWGIVSGVYLIHALAYFAHAGWMLPEGFRTWTTEVMGMYNGQAGPILYTLISLIGFVLFFRYAKFFTEPIMAWWLLNLSLLAGGWSMTDPNFRLIITKEDNVPIVMLVYSVGFFTWLAMRKATINDDRLAAGQPVTEKEDDDKVLVWPDLVYTELLCMVIATFLLVIWGVYLKAPLEQPATSAKAPNPSKAPWYFLGLQEMLVYFDPWMAGIVLPLMIVFGLMAIPYIDFNQKGNGYYSFKERLFAITMFQVGFILLWVTLIVLGTFLRGPNWNFFGPYEYWDTHKVLPLNNVNLSDVFWLPLGKLWAEGQPWYGILLREAPGILLVLAYLVVLPLLLAKTVMKPFFLKMGFLRFMLLVTLIQFMMSLPIKMILRWVFNLKYIVFVPEYFFNI